MSILFPYQMVTLAIEWKSLILSIELLKILFLVFNNFQQIN